MKKVIGLICISLFLSLVFSNLTNGQESKKVLKSSIDSLYKGATKRDLAHGVGEAWGTDHYYGEFKKGLPHGEGVYEYFEGSVYKGSFVKGLRHGMGEFSTFINGVDSLMAGIWENDRFMGPERAGLGYKIVRKLNVERYKVYKSGPGNKVTYKLNMTSSGASPGVSDVVMSGATGTEFHFAGFHGYENIVFPFNGKIRFGKWNKLHTAMHEVNFEIDIEEPGNWIIELY